MGGWMRRTGGNDAHIPTIDDFDALLVGIESPGQGPPTMVNDAAATDADAHRPKARARSVRHRGVEGHSEQCDVKRGRGVLKATNVGEMRKGEGTCELKVILLAVLFAPRPGIGGIAFRLLLLPWCIRVTACGSRVAERGLLVRARTQSLYNGEHDCGKE